ncbi:MAG: pentapeptide repeat-containing protein [Deltaproteobacteria bacterium]|jgi:uncharacterized protein YjbI with pentapeptide repeats/serine/threonine protein kinase|nr:pentapeptide repeat-containing protein [Deltaproteobacteria bacterium]
MRRLSERYSLGRCIGRGGVGEVYQGWQTALDRPVAIKLLREELTANQRAVARFEREARTTCLLSHPNVVTVFDVGVTDEGERFVVMELLEGETLADRLARGRMDLASAVSIARGIARGMGAGQGVGLVHRDLKPENIFLLQGDHVKVLDFGLATLLDTPRGLDLRQPFDPGRSQATTPKVDAGTIPDEPLSAPQLPVPDPREELDSGALPDPVLLRRTPDAPRLTRPGALMGTPRYMAPEQALSWGVDHRTDLYSFGVLLFEMLAGRTPFLGPGSRDFMHQHVHEAPMSLHRLAPELPLPLCELVMRLLEKSPSARFQDWSSLQEALRNADPNAKPERALAPLAPEPLPLPDEPFRFLHPFTAAYSSIFFGRDNDLQRFLDAWEHKSRPSLVLVTGASGVGKTSFLMARVLPALEQTGHELLRVRGTASPLELVTRAAHRRLHAQRDPSTGVSAPGPDAAPRSLPDLLDALSAAAGQPIVVVIDQLEEIFTEGSPEQLINFQAGVAALVAAADPRLRVLLSVREDYLGATLRALHPLPMAEISRTLPLRPLDAPDLRAALEGPGAPGLLVNYPPFTFEDGLLDEIVNDLIADDMGEVAPRVQAVGARLWDFVRDTPQPIRITAQHYRERLGGSRGILSRVLDEAISGLDAADQGVAKEMLRTLTHLPGSPTSRPTPLSELAAHSTDPERRVAILRALEDRWRVVHGYVDSRWPDERTYRIAHESLIAQVRNYGEEGSARNRARQLFHQGYSLWLKGGQSEADLLPSQHIDEVHRCIGDLVLRSKDERDFYDRSLRRLNEEWERTMLEARRRRLLRFAQYALVPSVVFVAGVLFGQAVAGFPSVGRVWAYTVSGLKITKADLSAFDLSGVDLEGAWFVGARFDGAQLRETALSHANLSAASLRGTRLDRADLHEANLQQADLSGAVLDEANLRETNLANAIFHDGREPARLDGADFSGAWYTTGTQWPSEGAPPGALGPFARLDDAVMVDVQPPPRFPCDLREARAARLRMTRGDLSACVLDEADLHDAVLTDVKLEEARLLNANLSGARLVGLNLKRARLTRADLRGADLTGADLSDADLAGADLSDADLCDADLRGAHLDQAKLRRTRACPGTQWPEGFTPPSPKDR